MSLDPEEPPVSRSVVAVLTASASPRPSPSWYDDDARRLEEEIRAWMDLHGVEHVVVHASRTMRVGRRVVVEESAG